jgi:hypothetical protein
LEETFEVRLEGGELALAGAYVCELAVEQGSHVRAGSVAAVAELDDTSHFTDGEAGRPGALDEPQAGDCRVVVGAVAVVSRRAGGSRPARS